MIWLRTAFFSSLFIGTMFVLLPAWILGAASGGTPRTTTGWSLLAGSLLIGGGFSLMLWCFGAFGVHGRGTPAPFDPPRRLVVRGPYRYVRNPMYIAGIFVIIGEAVLFGSAALVAYAAAYWLAVHLLVIGYEERKLLGSFGADYTAYCAIVRRWTPRLSSPSRVQRTEAR